MAFLIAAQDDEWAYVAGAYGLVIAVLVAYAAWTIVRGRRIGRRLPPEERRWM
ncbi:MAG TPA: heme exporter protein CcmD [Aquihabitans sp.]|jgi:heme exporter protein CcmD|nr:heme exporter protein CcmD [Aquihabitans sp.]